MWRELTDRLQERAALEGLPAIGESLDLLYAVWRGLVERSRAELESSTAGRAVLSRALEQTERPRILTRTALEIALREGAEAVDAVADRAGQAEHHQVVAERLGVRLAELEPVPDLGQFEPDELEPAPDLGQFEPDPVRPARPGRRNGSGLARALGVVVGLGGLTGVALLADPKPKRKRRRKR